MGLFLNNSIKKFELLIKIRHFSLKYYHRKFYSQIDILKIKLFLVHWRLKNSYVGMENWICKFYCSVMITEKIESSLLFMYSTTKVAGGDFY